MHILLHFTHRPIRSLALLLLLLIGVVSRLGAQEIVVVELHDGRQMRGQKISHSDDYGFHLKSVWPGIELTSYVAWSKVRSVNHRPLEFIPIPPPPVLPHSPHGFPVVQSVRVRSQLAHWDDDTLADGVQVWVIPLDGKGNIIPVKGSLAFQLTARRPERVHYNDPDDDESVIERWSRQIQPSDFGPHGALVRLPFQRIDPKRGFDFEPVAFLAARLGVGQQGTFDAPVSEVWFRLPGVFDDLPEPTMIDALR